MRIEPNKKIAIEPHDASYRHIVISAQINFDGVLRPQSRSKFFLVLVALISNVNIVLKGQRKFTFAKVRSVFSIVIIRVWTKGSGDGSYADEATLVKNTNTISIGQPAIH